MPDKDNVFILILNQESSGSTNPTQPRRLFRKIQPLLLRHTIYIGRRSTNTWKVPARLENDNILLDAGVERQGCSGTRTPAQGLWQNQRWGARPGTPAPQMQRARVQGQPGGGASEGKVSEWTDTVRRIRLKFESRDCGLEYFLELNLHLLLQVELNCSI